MITMVGISSEKSVVIKLFELNETIRVTGSILNFEFKSNGY